jgi:hypothetical protein
MFSSQRCRIGETTEGSRVRRMRKDRRLMGSPPNLSRMRRDIVLRFVAQSAREQARPRRWSSGNCFGAAD